MALFTSYILRENNQLAGLLASDPEFEMLTMENIAKSTKNLRYTTTLKAKGLEWDTVMLVCDSRQDPHAVFEIFIGASRARAKVYLLMGP